MCTTILPDLTAFVAALLFAVHPIHTEAVSTVSCNMVLSEGLIGICSATMQSGGCSVKRVWKWKGFRMENTLIYEIFNVQGF